MSGRYEDDVDTGETFMYTGNGGRSGKYGPQIRDQELTRGNLGLDLSRLTGQPVRVVRGHMLTSRWAPAEGYRYDGLYKVTDTSLSVGKSGYRTYKFAFERLPGQLPLPNEVLEPKRRRAASTFTPTRRIVPKSDSTSNLNHLSSSDSESDLDCQQRLRRPLTKLDAESDSESARSSPPPRIEAREESESDSESIQLRPRNSALKRQASLAKNRNPTRTPPDQGRPILL
ncbi:PUA-like domain-containing protein [Mycena crocata]|nr:PUA-like domain-containing protein [Mycena crocata]